MNSIVVIDDEAALRRLIATTLTAQGFDVKQAENGEAGIALCLAAAPSLVLSDIKMPGLSGFDVLSRLRAEPATPGSPGFMRRGAGDAADLGRGRVPGADDFLLKPFGLRVLVQAVQTRLARQEAFEARLEKRLADVQTGFGRTLGHELRTPLNAVLGYSSLLLEEGGMFSPAEIMEMAKGIHAAGRRLQRLVERQIAWNEIDGLEARPEARAGEDPAGNATCEREALKAASEAERAQDLVFEPAPEPEAGAAPVAISPQHLSLIARELADNAFKFSESGTKVKVSVERANGMFVLTIRDEGRGMSDDEIASVAAFRQFDRRSYEQQGLGIGLALARRTAELYDGTVDLAGNPDHPDVGLTAIARIPLIGEPTP